MKKRTMTQIIFLMNGTSCFHSKFQRQLLKTMPSLRESVMVVNEDKKLIKPDFSQNFTPSIFPVLVGINSLILKKHTRLGQFQLYLCIFIISTFITRYFQGWNKGPAGEDLKIIQGIRILYIKKCMCMNFFQIRLQFHT